MKRFQGCVSWRQESDCRGGNKIQLWGSPNSEVSLQLPVSNDAITGNLPYLIEIIYTGARRKVYNEVRGLLLLRLVR